MELDFNNCLKGSVCLDQFTVLTQHFGPSRWTQDSKPWVYFVCGLSEYVDKKVVLPYTKIFDQMRL